jgi:hypothetical protein
MAMQVESRIHMKLPVTVFPLAVAVAVVPQVMAAIQLNPVT